MKSTFLFTSIFITGWTLVFPITTSAIELPPEEILAGHKLIEDWDTATAEQFTNTLLKLVKLKQK